MGLFFASFFSKPVSLLLAASLFPLTLFVENQQALNEAPFIDWASCFLFIDGLPLVVFFIVVGGIFGLKLRLVSTCLGALVAPVMLLRPGAESFHAATEPNLALFNGLFFVHPSLLYTGLAILSIATLQYYQAITSAALSRPAVKMFSLLLYCLGSALSLGAVWAQQELNWGGWWSWDLVEVAALALLVLSIFLVHARKYPTLLADMLVPSWALILIFALGLRLALFPSVHNFTATDSFTLSEVFYIYFVLLVLILKKMAFLLNHQLFRGFKLFIFTTMLVFSYEAFTQFGWAPAVIYANLFILLSASFFLLLGNFVPEARAVGWAPGLASLLTGEWAADLPKKFMHYLVVVSLFLALLLRGYTYYQLGIHSQAVQGVSSASDSFNLITSAWAAHLSGAAVKTGFAMDAVFIFNMHPAGLEVPLGRKTVTFNLIVWYQSLSILWTQSGTWFILSACVPVLFLITKPWEPSQQYAAGYLSRFKMLLWEKNLRLIQQSDKKIVPFIGVDLCQR